MKKIIVSLIAILAFGLLGSSMFAAGCEYSADSDAPIDVSLRNCAPKGAMTSEVKTQVGGTLGKLFGGSLSVSDGGDYTLKYGVKKRVTDLTYQIMIVGGILAVGSIIVSSILMIVALGDEKKLGDAKNALKFSIIGFACIIIAFPLVNAVINLIYGVTG